MQEPLNQLLPKFIQSLEEKGRSPATILAYRADIEQLINFLTQDNKALTEKITTTDLEKFRDTLLADKYTPKSVSRKLNAVKTFFRWLTSENLTSNDPSKPVSHPKIETSVPKFLSQMEYRALRDVCRSDIRCAAIIELMLQTGLRISEVANLKMNDLNANEIIDFADIEAMSGTAYSDLTNLNYAGTQSTGHLIHIDGRLHPSLATNANQGDSDTVTFGIFMDQGPH